MTVNTGSIRIGVGHQAAKGTLATQPAYLFGVESGDIKPDPKFDDAPLTSGSATLTDRDLQRVELPFNFKTRAYVGSIGELLRAVLGGIATTGTTTYTHVLNHARPLPYLSVFKEFGAGGIVHAARDGKIKTLRLEWEENKPLMVTVDGVATVFSKPASITPGTDETGSQAFLSPAGGTFKYDVDSATPAVASVKGGFVEFVNDAEADFYSGTLSAGDVADNFHTASCGFTIRPADLTDWDAMVTAAIAGTPLYGSFEHTFVSGTASLKVEAARVGFVPGEIPAAAQGKAWETELGGACYKASGWAGPVKATLINSVASYTS